MKNVKIKKVMASLLIACTVIGGSFYSNVGPFKAIEAKAHFAIPHSYPGYLIRYNPSYYDSHVEVIQWMLNHTEYGEHTYNAGAIDGLFGSGTLNAVKAFQADHGLTVDGIVGSQTWNAIMYLNY